MARQKANQEGINKSAAIREILEQDPRAPVKQIVSTLDQRGITVHPNLVYLIKSKTKAKRGRQKKERALQNGREMGVANPVELIMAVRRLAEQAGGIRHLKRLVDVLAE
jgi:hypothetical protein